MVDVTDCLIKPDQLWRLPSSKLLSSGNQMKVSCGLWASEIASLYQWTSWRIRTVDSIADWWAEPIPLADRLLNRSWALQKIVCEKITQAWDPSDDYRSPENDSTLTFGRTVLTSRCGKNFSSSSTLPTFMVRWYLQPSLFHASHLQFILHPMSLSCKAASNNSLLNRWKRLDQGSLSLLV